MCDVKKEKEKLGCHDDKVENHSWPFLAILGHSLDSIGIAIPSLRLFTSDYLGLGQSHFWDTIAFPENLYKW